MRGYNINHGFSRSQPRIQRTTNYGFHGFRFVTIRGLHRPGWSPGLIRCRRRLRDPRRGRWIASGLYVDVPETPTEEELAALDPDLRAVLFGTPPGPFSFTLVFPAVRRPGIRPGGGPGPRIGAEYRETGSGAIFRHRAKYLTSDAARMRELFQLVGPLDACEVLVDERPVPYARELWLPLVWLLIS